MSIWTICQGLACLGAHELIPLSTQEGSVLAGLVFAVLKGLVSSSGHIVRLVWSYWLGHIVKLHRSVAPPVMCALFP